MNPSALAALSDALKAMGCPPDKSDVMAAQLDKRARQLGEQKDIGYEESLRHLLTRIQQQWAAQGRSMHDTSPISSPPPSS